MNLNNSQEELFVKILKGIDKSSLPFRGSRLVNIFFSSTFSDTHEERNHLIKTVYPKLRNYCKSEHDLDFQIIDLRWGISNNIALNFRTLFCIREVQRCFETSVKPSLITLLGHRYGQIFAPNQIEKQVFEILMQNMTLQNLSLDYKDDIFVSNNLLEQCYKLDENTEPSYFKLIDFMYLFENYDEKKMDLYEECWFKIEKKIKIILQTLAADCYARGLLNQEQKNHFFVSVTEEEIFAGLLNIPDPDDSCLVFLREIENYENIPNASNIKIVMPFIDIDDDQKIDQKSKSFLDELKYKKIESKISKNNIFKYTVKWDERNAISDKTHKEYLERLGNDIFINLKRLIDQNMNKTNFLGSLPTQDDKKFFKEILNHEYFCQDLVSKFQQREEIQNTLIAYVHSETSKFPFILFGESGCGKSSIIAKLAFDLGNQSRSDYVIILRFLGTTPMTSTMSLTLISIINHLNRLFSIEILNHDILNKMDVVQLRDKVYEMLDKVASKSPNKKIILLLDSIDQLSKKDYNLDWFFKSCPKNAKFIFSTLIDNKKNVDQDENIIVYKLRAFNFPPTNYLQIGHLTSEHALSILKTFLSNEKKLLKGPNQYELIKEIFQKCPLLYPLYVKIIFDIVADWKSYTIPNKDEILKLLSIDDCIKYLFSSIENEFGYTLVSRCLFYFTLFEGISDTELEDVLSLDDELLKVVFEYHEPPVRRFPMALWYRIRNRIENYITKKEIDQTEVYFWYHRRFIEVAHELYVNSLSDDQFDSLIVNIINIYNESFCNKPKKFEYSPIVAKKKKLLNLTSEQIRYINPQPIKLRNMHGNERLNERKLNKMLEMSNKLSLFSITRYSCLLNEIFLNYDFVKALFTRYFDVFNYSFHEKSRKECELVLSQDTKSNNSSLFILIQFIYICNMHILNKYPHNLSLQMTSKLLNLYGKSKLITQFIKSCDLDQTDCALVSAYQWQHLNSGNIRLVKNFGKNLYDNIGGGIEYILTDRIEIFLWKKGDVCKSIGNIQLPELHSGNHYEKLHFYDDDDSRDESLFVAAGIYNIVSLSYSGLINFSREFDESMSINKTYLLGKHAILVHYKRQKHFDILHMKTGKKILRKKFTSCVDIIGINRHDKLTWRSKNNLENLYIFVSLSNKQLFIYDLSCEFTKKNLEKGEINLSTIYQSEPFVYRILSGEFSINCFDESRKLNDEYLILTLENNECLLIKFNKTMMLNTSILRPILERTLDEKNLKLINTGRLIDGFVRMAEPKRALHLYDLILKKWLVIPGDFGTIKIRNLNDDLMILNYTKTSFDLYRIFNYCKFTSATTEFKMVKMISSFQFMDEIVDLALRDTSAAFAYLKNGALMEVNTESIILADNQAYSSTKSIGEANKIEYLNESLVLTYSTRTSFLNFWNAADGTKIETYKLDFEPPIKIKVCKDVFYLIGLDAQKKLIKIKAYTKDMSNSITLAGFSAQIAIEKSFFELNSNWYENTLFISYNITSTQICLNQIKYDDFKKQWIYNVIASNETMTNQTYSLSIKSNYMVFLNDKNNLVYKVFNGTESDRERWSDLGKTAIFSKIFPIVDSDNFIAVTNMGKDFALVKNLDQLEHMTLENEVFFSLENSRFLIFADEATKQRLTLYDLKKDSLVQPILIQQFQSQINFCCLTPDAKYLFVYVEARELRMIRLSDAQEIANVLILEEVTCLKASNEFISMTLQNGRFVSLLIVDPMQVEHKNRINQLESRKKDDEIKPSSRDVENCLNTFMQMLGDEFLHKYFNNNNNETNIPSELLPSVPNAEKDLEFKDLFEAFEMTKINKENEYKKAALRLKKDIGTFSFMETKIIDNVNPANEADMSKDTLDGSKFVNSNNSNNPTHIEQKDVRFNHSSKSCLVS